MWECPGDRSWPSDTDGAISGNKITCIAVCAFCTGNFALFQPISASGRAQIHEKSAGSCQSQKFHKAALKLLIMRDESLLPDIAATVLLGQYSSHRPTCARQVLHW